MSLLRLVSWKEGEARDRIRYLETLGYEVAFDPVDPGALLRTLQEAPPSVLVIDLSRAPSQGRDLGLAVRIRKSTRRVPLVFVGGGQDTVQDVRGLLPDAQFAPWAQVGQAVERSLTSPPEDPLVPDSPLAGYAGTPLTRKLGIKEGSRILLASPPPEYPSALGPLPPGVTVAQRYSPSVGLILWFVRSRRDLRRGMGKWSSRVGKEGIWIVWPKQASGVETDLRQSLVRRVGLDAGLVDYKIAAVDETWSGLKFARRR
jgi:hypothetical protein